MKTNHGHGMSNCVETAHGVSEQFIRNLQRMADHVENPHLAAGIAKRAARVAERNYEHAADTDYDDKYSHNPQFAQKALAKRKLLAEVADSISSDAFIEDADYKLRQLGENTNSKKHQLMRQTEHRLFVLRRENKDPNAIQAMEDSVRHRGGDPDSPQTYPTMQRPTNKKSRKGMRK
jgi:hypothetical protein